MGQPLHPSEFIAKTPAPHTTRSPALSYASGTASSCLSKPQRVKQFAARMRGDTTNLPVILFDPLDTDTDTNTNTDTPTDKENNND